MKILLIGIGIFAAVLSFGLYCCILSGVQEDRRLEELYRKCKDDGEKADR